MNQKFICHLLLPILCFSLTGCVSWKTEPLGNGYQEVTRTTTSWEPPSSRAELEYKKGWKTQMIWRDTLGVFVTNDIAIFTAFVADDQPPPDWRQATHSRLFAVKAPDMPLDITDELLWRWSKQSGENFEKFLKTASIANWKQTNNAVEFLFAADWNKDAIIRLDWNQISDVMREVKEKGVVQKDRIRGTKYLKKEFKTEVQK